jgi:hypothetical protein
MHLFLDCDGVLADFDRAATALLGMGPRDYQRRFGPGKFWGRIGSAPDFYGTLPLMPDARELFEQVAHLKPTILTGCPRGGWAEAQKARWAERHFPSTPIITCMARDKRDHGRPGDVLVDDTLTHASRWEEMGGVFVHHRSAEESLARLREMGVL